jgi:hypothetical protein
VQFVFHSQEARGFGFGQLLTGTPVHSETIEAMSSSVTSGRFAVVVAFGLPRILRGGGFFQFRRAVTQFGGFSYSSELTASSFFDVHVVQFAREFADLWAAKRFAA